MPSGCDIIQTVIGKSPGHQPASLEVHGHTAKIMASMDAIDVMKQQFIAAARKDFMPLVASGEIDSEDKVQKHFAGYAERAFRSPYQKITNGTGLKWPDCTET